MSSGNGFTCYVNRLMVEAGMKDHRTTDDFKITLSNIIEAWIQQAIGEFQTILKCKKSLTIQQQSVKLYCKSQMFGQLSVGLTTCIHNAITTTTRKNGGLIIRASRVRNHFKKAAPNMRIGPKGKLALTAFLEGLTLDLIRFVHNFYLTTKLIPDSQKPNKTWSKENLLFAVKHCPIFSKLIDVQAIKTVANPLGIPLPVNDCKSMTNSKKDDHGLAQALATVANTTKEVVHLAKKAASKKQKRKRAASSKKTASKKTKTTVAKKVKVEHKLEHAIIAEKKALKVTNAALKSIKKIVNKAKGSKK